MNFVAKSAGLRCRRSTLLFAILIAAACHWATAPIGALAQEFPSKPIKLILPFGAGSPPDSLGRLIAQQLSGRLGQSVTVENRPGAGSTIGTKAAAIAEPNGYTLLQVNSAFAYGQVLYPNSGYDPLKSFSPVASLAAWSLLLVVNPDVPASTAAELVAYAKAHPGGINIGHTLGSPPQVLAEMFKKTSGAPINTVPYREVSLLTADLLSGRIHAFFGGGAGVLDLVQQGRLKALAHTGTARWDLLPSLPSIVESGFPPLAFNPTDWAGIVAPSGTPRSVIDTLNRAINESLDVPEVRVVIAKQGAEPRTSSASEFAAFIAAEVEKWPARVAKTGLTGN